MLLNPTPVIIDTDGKHEHGHSVGDHLYIHQHSLVHDLPAHVKVVAALSFVFIAVLTPVHAVWAFACYVALLAVVIRFSKLTPSLIFRRMIVEVPFLFFAILMPFFSSGPYIEIGPLELSEAGSWAAFGILIKGTIGVVTSITLAATTRARDLLQGLERIGVPDLLVQIATFMLRYSAVVTNELSRMKVARESRGFSASGVKHWRILGQSAGALFIRSYERGERVHLAMLSRGYKGTFTDLYRVEVTRSQWVTALTLPFCALLILAIAWTTL